MWSGKEGRGDSGPSSSCLLLMFMTRVCRVSEVTICSHGRGMPKLLVVGSIESHAAASVEKESMDLADSTLRDKAGASEVLGGERALLGLRGMWTCFDSLCSFAFKVDQNRQVA